MYSPWFSNMPGNNDPTYWNYKNENLDTITQKNLYVSDFASAEERISLIRTSNKRRYQVNPLESFLLAKIDQYVVK